MLGLFASKKRTARAHAAILALCALAVSPSANAQSVTSPSQGCDDANAGMFDFSVGAATSLTADSFSSTFADGETLTFTLSAGGGNVTRGFAEDATDGVTILDSTNETSANYSIPADGARDFNLELETSDFAADITVTCAPATPSGSITISKQGPDGDYDFSGDLDNFTITVAGDPGSSSFNNLTPGSYIVSEDPDSTTALSDIVCTGDTDNGTVIDVSARQATIDLDDGESINCAFINAPITPPGPTDAEIDQLSQHVIRNFLYRRASALLTSEPDRPRLIRKEPRRLGPNVSEFYVRANDEGANADFAASSSSGWIKNLDLWVEGHYASYNFDNGVKYDGDFGVVYLGADIMVSKDVLVGVLGSKDWSSDESEAMGESASGDGWMVGPYFSAEVSDNVFLDLRGAWGGSTNDLSIASIGVNDQFTTDRWLLRGALTGNREYGRWRVTPTASVVYFEEEQSEYTSSSGALVGSQTVKLGRATFEPELAYRYETDAGLLIEPQVSVAGIWDFERPDGLSIPGWNITADAFRLRFGGGILIAAQNGIGVRAAGYYDGIASGDLKGYGARLWLNIPIAGRNGGGSTASTAQMKRCDDGSIMAIDSECPTIPTGPSGGDIAFAQGKSNISEAAYADLAALWAAAQAAEPSRIVIRGGGDDANGSALALRRARAISEALVAMGASPEITSVEAGGPLGAVQVAFEY